MKKYLLMLMTLLFVGCSPAIKEEEFIGVWLNEEEDCKIQFNNDFTFNSTNIPLDVANKHYLAFNKELDMWQGNWLIENKQLKLIIGDSYYYIDISSSFFSSKLHLCVRLLEESGGDMICLDKQEQ